MILLRTTECSQNNLYSDNPSSLSAANRIKTLSKISGEYGVSTFTPQLNRCICHSTGMRLKTNEYALFQPKPLPSASSTELEPIKLRGSSTDAGNLNCSAKLFSV